MPPKEPVRDNLDPRTQTDGKSPDAKKSMATDAKVPRAAMAPRSAGAALRTVIAGGALPV